MRLFLLSLLAIGCAKSFTIGSPYRSAYWAYNPARGEFPVQSSISHGYLRYFDNSGNERLVTYNYPEPVFGIRYLSSGQSSNSPALKTFGQDDSIEFTKSREAHFRAWALQQYQALKCEMDALRAEGKEPSADMYLKFRPLEKIALTADFSEISYIPEVKHIREDHLRIWNEARNKNLQTEAGRSTYQQSIVNANQGEFKTYNGQPSSTLVTVGGTPEQNQAHEEHLRIHSEQVAHLRHLESEHQQQFGQKSSEQQPQQAEALADFERAKKEHLRLWNEAKLRAGQASFNIHGATKTTNKEYEGSGKQQISALKHDQSTHPQEHLNLKSAEIQKAHEDYLRLVSDATQRIHTAEDHNNQVEQKNFKSSPAVFDQSKVNQQVLDTPEVTRAREEHLRLVNEAKLRAEIAEQQEQEHSKYLPAKIEIVPKVHETAGEQPISQLKYVPNIDNQQHTYQTEFQKARDDHTRLVNEATLKIKAAEEHIKQLEGQQSTSSESQIQSHHSIEQSNLKSTIPIEQQQVIDTPEVMRARDEHLRLVNEAQLRAQRVEQQERKYSQENVQESYQVPLLKTQLQQQQDGFHYGHSEFIKDTPEVIRAREEHLRLLNVAKGDQNAQYNAQQQSSLKSHIHQEHYKQQDFQQSSESHHIIEDTPEVKNAREEHLRIFNTVKLHNEQEEAKVAKMIASGILSKPLTNDEELEQIKEKERLTEETRLLEIQGLREAERLQEEFRQMELERLREEERLAEEQVQIKADLKNLKIEDDNRFQTDKLLEERRLKQEQDELQKLQLHAQEYKQTEIHDAEPLIKLEARLLELQGLPATERLQEEYRQRELERIREAEILAREQQQIKTELKLLKIEDDNRFQMEKSLEERRLKQEQEELQKQQQLDTETNKQTQTVTKTLEQIHTQQQQHKYANNPFLRANPIQSHVQQFTYSNNPFLKSSSIKTPIVYYPIAITPNNAAVQPANVAVIPVSRYIQSSQNVNTGSKLDTTTKFQNAARTQPADTAVALIALQRATNEHFRAHELALEQLRLARLQNPDCN